MTEESRAAQIERAIRETAGLDVVVEESDGTILLEGIVDSERDREAAEDIATDLAGDVEIDNALEVQDTRPTSVEAFNSEQRGAEATDLAARDGREDLELEPDFTAQSLTDDPRAVAGPTGGAGDESGLDDGDHAYVPPIDPVTTIDQSGQEVVLGGFSTTALDGDAAQPLAGEDGFGDEAIADAVRQELREDAATTDLDVRVVVRDGVVYLHGRVADLDDADAADEVASRVPAVREVREGIDVLADD